MDIPLDEVVYFDVCTHNPATGAVSDADSTPTFAVYEEATDTDIGVGGNLTKRTSLTGNYRGSFTQSSENGFEVGKFYNVIASATVNSIAGKKVVLTFRCVAAENVAGVPQADVVAIGGATQSATDLKDFADTGYDPSTHKVAGVVLVDTTTTNSDMRGTDSANTTTPPSASAIADEVQTRTIAAVTTVAGLAANALTDTAIATAAANKIRDAVWNALLNAYNSLGTMGYHIVELFSDAASVESRLTSTRAGYLDNLNISGNVASSAEVTSVQNNTRVVRVVPTVIERPDSGTTTYRIELLAYDNVGNMEAPDSAPTLDLVNQAGDDLTSRLDSTTGTLVSTGRYRWVYTASSTDDLEQLIWTFSVAEGSATRLYGNGSVIVDTTAVDFTSADRTKLEAIHTKLPSKSYLTGTDNSDGDVEMDEATGNYAGSVGSVTGDVGGKVLGGGSGTITGTGARSDVRAWNGSAPGNLDANGYVPSNLAAVNGNLTRASNFATALDNYSATRGLAGTALPAAAADAAGGLPISDAGGLDLDAKLANTNEVTAARMGALTDWIDGGRLDLILDAIATNVAAILADTGTDGVALSAALCNKIADHVRRRTQANVEASSDGDGLSLGSQYGFIQQAQESSVSGGTMTVYKTDGTTPLGTKTLTTDADAEPVVGVS